MVKTSSPLLQDASWVIPVPGPHQELVASLTRVYMRVRCAPLAESQGAVQSWHPQRCGRHPIGNPPAQGGGAFVGLKRPRIEFVRRSCLHVVRLFWLRDASMQ